MEVEIDLALSYDLGERMKYITYCDEMVKRLQPDGIGFDIEIAKKQLPWLKAKVYAIERYKEMEKGNFE